VVIKTLRGYYGIGRVHDKAITVGVEEDAGRRVC
jgi:hypothetical protein